MLERALCRREIRARCGRSPTQSWLERDRFLRADRLIDTNSMELAVYANAAEEQILAVASLDNLGKGASGAAVQTINLKTGVDETTGLTVA